MLISTQFVELFWQITVDLRWPSVENVRTEKVKKSNLNKKKKKKIKFRLDRAQKASVNVNQTIESYTIV